MLKTAHDLGPRFPVGQIGSVAVLLSACAHEDGASRASFTPEQALIGESIAQEQCSACHPVGVEGDSLALEVLIAINA